MTQSCMRTTQRYQQWLCNLCIDCRQLSHSFCYITYLIYIFFRFIAKYQELEKNWDKSEEELFEATAKELAKEGTALRKRGERRKGAVRQVEKVRC